MSDQDRWGEGYRAGVIEGLCRAERHLQDLRRSAQIGIPYEPGLPEPDAAVPDTPAHSPNL